MNRISKFTNFTQISSSNQNRSNRIVSNLTPIFPNKKKEKKKGRKLIPREEERKDEGYYLLLPDDVTKTRITQERGWQTRRLHGGR